MALFVQPLNENPCELPDGEVVLYMESLGLGSGLRLGKSTKLYPITIPMHAFVVTNGNAITDHRCISRAPHGWRKLQAARQPCDQLSIQVHYLDNVFSLRYHKISGVLYCSAVVLEKETSITNEISTCEYRVRTHPPHA